MNQFPYRRRACAHPALAQHSTPWNSAALSSCLSSVSARPSSLFAGLSTRARWCCMCRPATRKALRTPEQVHSISRLFFAAGSRSYAMKNRLSGRFYFGVMPVRGNGERNTACRAGQPYTKPSAPTLLSPGRYRAFSRAADYRCGGSGGLCYAVPRFPFNPPVMRKANSSEDLATR